MYMNKKHSNCLLSVVTFAAIWLVLYFKGRHMLYLQEQLQLFVSPRLSDAVESDAVNGDLPVSVLVPAHALPPDP